MGSLRVGGSTNCCQRTFDENYPPVLAPFVTQQEYSNSIRRINTAIKPGILLRLVLFVGGALIITGIVLFIALFVTTLSFLNAVVGFGLFAGGVFISAAGRYMLNSKLMSQLNYAVNLENGQYYSNRPVPVSFRIDNPIVGFSVTVSRGWSSVSPIRRLDLCIDYGIPVVLGMSPFGMMPAQTVVNNHYHNLPSPHGVPPMSGYGQPGVPLSYPPNGGFASPQSMYGYPQQPYPPQYPQYQQGPPIAPPSYQQSNDQFPPVEKARMLPGGGSSDQ